ncbi:unnamed protein product [Bursaphelenchus okinawaensis]|uniref:Nuclear receptor domain-containing protein n=1 Tax=Bursaphelenchus okinawaensis TaxID=465554 RepID=A0A811LKM3_9BILA|nr:unnamed protein product [Bursaphelenchus okinawaensis]CAG9124814.1 unnamed protein product [Bursaphelenchus okinawaensis]
MFETLDQRTIESESPEVEAGSPTDQSCSNEDVEDYQPSADDQGKCCLVCGHISHGCHFGILACRACAAFFRRTVAEKKVYKCRQNAKCPIRKEMRNMCRACRFKKCIALGMNKKDVQMNRDPIGRRKEVKTVDCCGPSEPSSCYPSSQSQPDSTVTPNLLSPTSTMFSSLDLTQIPSTFQQTLLAQKQNELNANENQMFMMPNNIRNMNQTSAIALLPYTPPAGPSLLQRMHEGYTNYQSSQKSLYTVMYPENIFSADKYRMVKHSEHLKMERGCLSLLFSMVNDWFQPFDTLSHEIKVVVLRQFSSSFSHLDQAYKTMQEYPQGDDTRWVLHYGQYCDITNFEHFFAEDKDPSIAAKMCRPIMIRCRHFVAKMKRLQVREVEIAALAGVLLWNEVGLATSYEGSEKIRDRIYSELHSNIIITYGVNETGARMGALLCLLNDVQVLHKQAAESSIISKMFNPHVCEMYDE